MRFSPTLTVGLALSEALPIIISLNIHSLKTSKKSKIRLSLSNFSLWCFSLKVSFWRSDVHSIVLLRTISGLTNFLVCVTQIPCQPEPWNTLREWKNSDARISEPQWKFGFGIQSLGLLVFWVGPIVLFLFKDACTNVWKVTPYRELQNLYTLWILSCCTGVKLFLFLGLGITCTNYISFDIIFSAIWQQCQGPIKEMKSYF